MSFKSKIIKSYRDPAKTALWKKGALSWKLHDCQKPLYKKLVAAINDPKCLKYTVNCSRRFGKTTVLFLIAVEFAIKNPASNIRFFAAYQNMIQEILKEVSPVILEDAPQSIMPKFSKGKFYFKNGSVIHMAGLDNKQYNTSRGRATHLNILDEARDISELDHIYKSVLSPTTITTKGTCIFASTPPDSPAHDFVSLAKQCEAEGYYSKYTIWDNTRLDNNVVQQYIKELGGVDSVQFRREYLAEFILDEEKAVVKEWNTSKYVYEEPRDEYWHLYHRYIAMDVGVKDMTACIFGYYDFNKAKLFIEDEFHLQGNDVDTSNIAAHIKEKIQQHWTINQLPLDIYRKISDVEHLLINDLGRQHQLYFRATAKRSKIEMVNSLRMRVKEGRIIVHPRCKKLIGCLENAVWAKPGTNSEFSSFDRLPGYGHFDHLDALIYLNENLDQVTNPIPNDFKHTFSHFTNKYSETVTKLPTSAKTLETAFKPRINFNKDIK